MALKRNAVQEGMSPVVVHQAREDFRAVLGRGAPMHVNTR